jgi:hypothetical protein
MGRIVLEDRDSVILGLAQATVIPGEGDDGFYRGVFDPTRFAGGGITTNALTEPILAGPIPVPGISPAYREPEAADFIAAIPQETGLQSGDTAILVEARGWGMRADGNVDEASGPSDWSTLGWFEVSGIVTEPRWNPSATQGLPSDVSLPPDNLDTLRGFAPLTGYGFVQIRLTFYLTTSATPLTPGPYVDRMVIRFGYDQ